MTREPSQAWLQLRLVADAMRQLVYDGQLAGVAAEVCRNGALVHRLAVGHSLVDRHG